MIGNVTVIAGIGFCLVALRLRNQTIPAPILTNAFSTTQPSITITITATTLVDPPLKTAIDQNRDFLLNDELTTPPSTGRSPSDFPN
jgi:hypothetical protein